MWADLHEGLVHAEPHEMCAHQETVQAHQGAKEHKTLKMRADPEERVVQFVSPRLPEKSVALWCLQAHAQLGVEIVAKR